MIDPSFKYKGIKDHDADQRNNKTRTELQKIKMDMGFELKPQLMHTVYPNGIYIKPGETYIYQKPADELIVKHLKKQLI